MQAAGMVSRVRNEVEIQSRLKHPSILEVRQPCSQPQFQALHVLIHAVEKTRELKSFDTALLFQGQG